MFAFYGHVLSRKTLSILALCGLVNSGGLAYTICRFCCVGWKTAEEMMEREIETLRRCKRCLMRDMAEQEEYFQSLRDYIENLDTDIKSPDPLYEDRLAVCRECELLLSGMCRSCGCYVELRAAITKNRCPIEKW